MRRSILLLGLLALGLILVASLAPILSENTGAPYEFISLRGESVEVYGGSGVYRYDSVFKAVLFQGFDWANLFVCAPLLIWGLALFLRRQKRGELLLAAIFSYLAYNYLIGVMGNAFNGLFLVWTALYSVGLFGLALVLWTIDAPSLATGLQVGFPRKTLSVYLFVLALFLAVQYLSEILFAYADGGVPGSLGLYTTLELAALELGVMIPLHVVAGVLLIKRKPVGYVLAILLTFTAMMTFISLSVSMGLFYFSMEQGSIMDVVVPVLLTLVASILSIWIYWRVKLLDREPVTA